MTSFISKRFLCSAVKEKTLKLRAKRKNRRLPHYPLKKEEIRNMVNESLYKSQIAKVPSQELLPFIKGEK